MVFIFLPPSEGKTEPRDSQAPGVDLEKLVLPEIAPAREEVAAALEQVSSHEQAQRILKVGNSVMDHVRANAALRQKPAAPAHEVYTGVLYDALRAAELNAHALQAAEREVLIFSGLFGVAGFTDRIPPYRLAMGVDLQVPGSGRGPGKLGRYWREVLTGPLSERVAEHLVVDCRSSAYTQAFRPPARQTLAVNSFRSSGGKRTVVTHFAKQARGELAGMLARRTDPAETVDEVAHIASSRWNVEVRPATGQTPHQLDLIDHA